MMSVEKKNEKIVENNTSNKKNSVKKWIIIGIIAFVSISVIANYGSDTPQEWDGSYLETDKSISNSEISNNVYRNTKYNFRINFPEGWEIKTGSGQDIVQKASSGSSAINIGVKEISDDYGLNDKLISDLMTLDEYKDSLSSASSSKMIINILDYGDTKIGNVFTYWAKYSTPYTTLDVSFEATMLAYQLFYKNILYTITAGSVSEDFPSSESVLKQSISTFVIEDY